MALETERLLLRRWNESDAKNLYTYARDPDIGPPAGWPPNKSVPESREIIKTVLNGSECYAVCLKADGRPVGCMELKLNGRTDLTDRDDECELGFWIGKPFWGRGLIPEAARVLLRRAFTELGMQKVWCAYYDGNEKSKRAQQKIGFRFQRTIEHMEVPLLGEVRKCHVNCMTKEEWEALS